MISFLLEFYIKYKNVTYLKVNKFQNIKIKQYKSINMKYNKFKPIIFEYLNI